MGQTEERRAGFIETVLKDYSGARIDKSKLTSILRRYETEILRPLEPGNIPLPPSVEFQGDLIPVTEDGIKHLTNLIFALQATINSMVQAQAAKDEQVKEATDGAPDAPNSPSQ